MAKSKEAGLPKHLTVPKDQLEIYATQELGLSLHGLGLDYDAIERRCLEVEHFMMESKGANGRSSGKP